MGDVFQVSLSCVLLPLFVLPRFIPDRPGWGAYPSEIFCYGLSHRQAIKHRTNCSDVRH